MSRYTKEQIKKASFIKAIFFDLGKVLVDFSVERACRQIAAVTKTDSSAVNSLLFASGLETQFELGNVSTDDLHKRFESALGCKIDRAELILASSDIIELLPSSVQLLQDLRIKFNGPLLLLSNTNEIHWDFIQTRWNFTQLFDHRILSYQVNSMKPDPAIYFKALETSGCSPANCFFTDDLTENVSAAIALGIDAVRFSSAQQIRKELEQRGVDV